MNLSEEHAYFLVKLVAALLPHDLNVLSASLVDVTCGLRLLTTESRALPFLRPR
jgi:hypothetical protein